MSNFWRNHKRLIILLFLLAIPLAIYATAYTYKYPAETTLASTAGFGGTDYTASSTTNTYTGDIDLETNGYYGMWLSVQASSSGVTDNLVLSYYASYDGTNFDTRGNEFWTVSMSPSGQSASQTTFQIVPAPPHGRIGLRSSGATTNFGYKIVYIPVYGDGT